MGKCARFSIGGMSMNIDIKTPGGYMLIDPDLFFPASRSDLLKLKKIIYDPYSGEGEAKAKEIFDYLYSEIQYLIDKEIAINSSYFPLEQHKDKLWMNGICFTMRSTTRS